MIQKMILALCASIILSFSWLGIVIFNTQKTEYKNEIDRENIKENRIEDESNFDSNQLSDSNDGFVLVPSNVKYDSIKKYYTASNSYLIASYNFNNKQIRLELTFKADGSWFLYHGLENEIAYEGEYKLVDKIIYAKVNKFYNSNDCYTNGYGVYEFNILNKNGKKVIDLDINDTEFIEINKKLLNETNNKFKNRDKINSCI